MRLITTVTVFLIICLLLVIVALCWLVNEQSKTIRQMETLNFRDRSECRTQLTDMLQSKDNEIKSLVESYCRMEGKVYVTPVTIRDGKPADRPTHPDPPQRAFAFKPPPPMTENSAPPKVGTPAAEPKSGGMRGVTSGVRSL